MLFEGCLVTGICVKCPYCGSEMETGFLRMSLGMLLPAWYDHGPPDRLAAYSPDNPRDFFGFRCTNCRTMLVKY